MLTAIGPRAEGVLAATFERPIRVRVEAVLSSTRASIVARVRTVAGASDVPDSFVVKAAQAGAPGAAEMLLTEWAATRLLTEAGEVPLCARLYGGDASLPLVVLEDLGDGSSSPYEVVEGDDPELATGSLLDYIRSIARLHSDTRGLAERYAVVRGSLGSIPAQRPLYHDPWSDATERAEAELRHAVEEYRTVLDAIGVEEAPGLEDEIISVSRRVECDPGEWLALCQGDQNGLRHCLLAAGQLRLHDFGVAGFRHSLLEALPHRITWGCVQRIPRDVMLAMDRAYEDALAAAVPAPRAAYRGAVADALARWHILHIVWRLPPALRRDRPRGPTSLRQQILAGLDAFVLAQEDHEPRPALAATAQRVAQRLRRTWPAETHTIPLYRAFRHTACDA